MRNDTIVCLPPLPEPYRWDVRRDTYFDINNDSLNVTVVARVIFNDFPFTAMLWGVEKRQSGTWRHEFNAMQEAIDVVATRVLLGEFT